MKPEAIDHPKMHLLARELGIPLYGANGIMERLWQWAGAHVLDGHVGRWPDEVISRACAWDGEPSALVRGLSAARLIDPHESDRFVLHDWIELRDRLVRERERKRVARAKEARRKASGVNELRRPRTGADSPRGRAAELQHPNEDDNENEYELRGRGGGARARAPAAARPPSSPWLCYRCRHEHDQARAGRCPSCECKRVGPFTAVDSQPAPPVRCAACKCPASRHVGGTGRCMGPVPNVGCNCDSLVVEQEASVT